MTNPWPEIGDVWESDFTFHKKTRYLITNVHDGNVYLLNIVTSEQCEESLKYMMATKLWKKLS
jgi:hypothetical protein